ncbi:MAG: hypothetical protein JO189_05215 [Deltaproteobacteria bacterium]|nr:hypothetical protein [Deltaproteobacteria bacterium]
MNIMIMEEVGKPMVVKEWPEPQCPSDGAMGAGGSGTLCRAQDNIPKAELPIMWDTGQIERFGGILFGFALSALGIIAFCTGNSPVGRRT